MKVWFQNRRMKHKRQTLSKQAEDGDDKDGSSGKSGKSDKSLLLDDKKKSCQNCELPPGVLGDHLPRNNNNNSTTFNNNSNASSGGSSVTSTPSSFEKLEDDSRSNEGSGVLTSPGLIGGVKRHPSEVVVKVEGGSLCVSPGVAKKPIISVKDNLLANRLIMSPDSMNKPPGVLTPSSTPGTPSGPSPLDPSAPVGPYPQNRPRSSPTAATAVATATASVTTVLQHPNQNMMTPSLVQIVRCSAPNSFPSPPQQRTNATDYRGQPYRQPVPYSRDLYSQRPSYPGDTPPYRQQPPRQNGVQMMGSRPPASQMHQNVRYQQVHQQYCGTYNGYGQTEYANYHRNYPNQPYPEDPYGVAPGSTNYGAYHGNVYPSGQPQTQGVNHPHEGYYNEVHQNYEFSTKPHGGYYEGMTHQGGEASSVPSHYGVSSPEQFPNNSAPAPPVMTPPNSVRADSSGDHFNSFHHFYSEPQTHHPNHHGSENSNSSSDFNFLSNLANDFAPEYYQLS